MNSSRSRLGNHSWFEHNEQEKLTIAELHQSLTMQIEPLQEICATLQASSQPFQQPDEIFPYQCRKAIRQLILFHAHVEDCTSRLKDISTLPLVFLALRFRLLDEFYIMKDWSLKLIDLIRAYHQSYPAAYAHQESQRRKICEIFASLIHSIERIPQITSFLINEAHFQQKQITNEILPL